MCRGLPASISDTAQLLVSELIVNAHIHGTLPVSLRITRNRSILRVEVSDPNAPPSSGDSQAEPERALFLLAALATSWGNEPRARDGTQTLWFELDRRTHQHSGTAD
jgi:anti-sigma regulatory factor (Ser/Thr protein kinase)